MRVLTVALGIGLLIAVGSGRVGAVDGKKEVSCGDIAVVMEESNGSLSAEEVAKKLNTTEAKVRECWRQQEAPKKDDSQK